MCFPTDPEATSPQWWCCQGHVGRASRLLLVPLSAFGSPGCSLVCGCVTAVSASTFTRLSFFWVCVFLFTWLLLSVSVSSSHEDSSHVGLRAQPTPMWPYLNGLYLNSLISKWDHILKLLRLELQHIFCGGHKSNHNISLSFVLGSRSPSPGSPLWCSFLQHLWASFGTQPPSCHTS